MRVIRTLTITSLLLLAGLLQTGCTSGAYVATKLENASRAKEAKKNIAIFHQYIQSLQAKGDPMGDYYYALGNADGWIKDVTDPQAITALFEKAAAKDAMDAKILLALQQATSEPMPGHLDDGMGPRENLVAWESGLAKLLPLLQQQCYARRLVVGNPVTNEPRPKVRYYSIAYKIWPIFRDGHHVLNKQGEYELKVAKDAERQKLWEGIDRNCNRPQKEWLDTMFQTRSR